MKEIYLFDSEEEMIEKMKQLEIPEEMIEYTLTNERPHFQKARELGYKTKYKIIFERDAEGNPFAYTGQIDVEFWGEVNLSHLEQISLSTLNLSKDDISNIMLARRLKQKHNKEILTQEEFKRGVMELTK